MDNQPSTDNTRSTRNYASFGFINTNRDIVPQHVNRLVRAMQEYGNFTEINPVLVNERMQVIDGQHRLEACRELNLPVYYRLMPSLSIDEARQMNILNRNWTAVDYLESFAREGRPAYIALKEIKDEYPEIPSMSILVTYAKGNQSKGYMSTYRKGELEEFDTGLARERLTKLRELQEVSEVFNPKTVAFALLYLFRHPDYDHERMMRKVNTHRNILRPYQNVTDNLRMLEEVYNVGYSEANRLRFF